MNHENCYTNEVDKAETKGARYIYRTGAAFVSTRLGLPPKQPITAAELHLPTPRKTGGLILAGSYVPKTTAQLRFLTEKRGSALSVIEMRVEDLIASEDSAAALIRDVVRQTEGSLEAGKDTLVMTSRALIKGDDELSSLAIGSRVAEALVRVLRGVERVRPRYVVAKVPPCHILPILCLSPMLMVVLGRDHVFRCGYKGSEYEAGFDCWPGSSRCASLEMR